MIDQRDKYSRPSSAFPLRDVVLVIREGAGLFKPHRVEFECGHKGLAYSKIRGRCLRCPPMKEPS